MMYLNSEGYGYAKAGRYKHQSAFPAYGRGEKGGFFVFVTDDKTAKRSRRRCCTIRLRRRAAPWRFITIKHCLRAVTTGWIRRHRLLSAPTRMHSYTKLLSQITSSRNGMLTLTFYTDVILTKKQDDEAHRRFPACSSVHSMRKTPIFCLPRGANVRRTAGNMGLPRCDGRWYSRRYQL